MHLKGALPYCFTVCTYVHTMFHWSTDYRCVNHSLHNVHKNRYVKAVQVHADSNGNENSIFGGRGEKTNVSIGWVCISHLGINSLFIL